MTDEAFKHCPDCNIDFMYNYCPKCGKHYLRNEKLIFKNGEYKVVKDDK